MNFKMPQDFVKRFKREALERDMKLNELFEVAFNAFVGKGKKSEGLDLNPSNEITKF